MATRTRRGTSLVQAVTSVATMVGLTATILVPGLIGLRDRNRQAVCTARIGQLTKALLVYAQDFDETPPFLGLGWEDIHYPEEPSQSMGSTAGAPGDISSKSEWGWAVAESWISANPEQLWNATIPEANWPDIGAGVTTGLLFPYANYERLYRCPEFERIPGKSQSAFNYTRSMLGRKWILGGSLAGPPEPGYWGASDFGAVGPIMRTSEIHAPGRASILHDEWWERHVGAPYDEHVPPRDSAISGGWMAVDPIHFPLGDELGQYHGCPVPNEYFPRNDPPARDPELIQQGSVSFYDGHVDLQRQWWAGISSTSASMLFNSMNDALLPKMQELIYATRGVELVVGEP